MKETALEQRIDRLHQAVGILVENSITQAEINRKLMDRLNLVEQRLAERGIDADEG